MVSRQIACLLCLIILPWITAFSPSSEVDVVLSAQLDQPFTVMLGQSALLTEEELSVTFQDVLEDSRYPSNVDCAETGQARSLISVSRMGQSPISLEMTTNPPLKQDVVAYENYQIRLLELNPYPLHPSLYVSQFRLACR